MPSFECKYPPSSYSNNKYSSFIGLIVNLMIEQEYGAGRMLTGEVKKRLTDVLTELVERHRMARAAVTDEVKYSILLP